MNWNLHLFWINKIFYKIFFIPSVSCLISIAHNEMTSSRRDTNYLWLSTIIPNFYLSFYEASDKQRQSMWLDTKNCSVDLKERKTHSIYYVAFKNSKIIAMHACSILESETPKSKTSSGNMFTDIDIFQWKLILWGLTKYLPIILKKHRVITNSEFFLTVY